MENLPGKWWRHVIINTLGSWLHGAPRGFRSRRHRIHSSGDYKNPPPPDEHAGLYHYQLAQASAPVEIEVDLREIVGRAFCDALQDAGHRVLVGAVGQKHSHSIVELPDNIIAVRAIVGDAKRIASRAVKKWMPGRVWSHGGEYRRIKDDHHLTNAYDYIFDAQEEDAWVWASEEGERIRTALEHLYPRRCHSRRR